MVDGPTAVARRDRWRFVPIVGWIRSYDRRWLRGDLVAGVAVAALIVPKNLGYAGIAGIPLQNGLYAAAAGAILYADLRHQPADLDRAELGTGGGGGQRSASPPASPAPRTSPRSSPVITLVSGVLFLLLAVFKMGWIAQFLSRAVVTGFLFGAAIDVVIGELPKLTGTEVTGSNSLQELWSWLGTLGDIDRATCWSAGRARGGLRAAAVAPRVPAPSSWSSAVWSRPGCFDLGAHGVALVGDVPRGLPTLEVPDVSCCGTTPARSRSPPSRWCSSGSRRPPGTPGCSRPSTATASTSTRSRSPRAWRTSAPACSRGCRCRRACRRAR